MSLMSKEDIRKKAEEDLWFFARLVNPTYVYGEIHERVFKWLMEDEDQRRKLLLLPRAHLKSHCIATWAAWEITRHPWTSIVYLSAGEELAKQQVYAIKNMMTSETYKRYWPEMFKEKISERDQWTAFGFNVDHPLRKQRAVRDNTILVRTVKSNAIGLHCDHVVYDDVVIPQFAYTEVGRSEVRRAISQYNSILNNSGSIKAVGTRYHPQDAYSGWLDAYQDIWDADLQEFVGQRKVWDVMEEKTEDKGDGTGEFLWPKEVSTHNGEAYGFDPGALALIKAEYLANGQASQFWAQYYNDPNNIDNARVGKDMFQYYDRKHLRVSGGTVYYSGEKLNVFAAMDIAWSGGDRSDYTAIAVIGMDREGFIYILDLDQFKTSHFQEYYNRVISLQNQWGFRRIRIESNAGGKFVAQELENIARRNGNSLIIDAKATTSHDGKKWERHAAILEPKYHQQAVFHYKGGYITLLEEQIMLERPPHDDLEDALCAAIEISKAPGKRANSTLRGTGTDNIVYDTRFGGRKGRII